MDAITLLKEDHRAVEKLFKRFEKAGDRAYVEKREVVDRIIEELSKHAAVEEMLFYPVTRATVPETDDVVLESIEEHHVVKWLLHELETLEPQAENFDAKVTVLIENVRHHVKEEEEEYFPQVREELGRKALGELGDAMEEAKATAPTHPHPRSPSAPPANVLVGNTAGLVDRVHDTVSGIVQGGLAAVGDVIDRVRGTQRPKPAPVGNSVTRKAADDVRSTTNEALDRAIAAVKDAKVTGEATAKQAVAAVTDTADAARTGAKRTLTSVERNAEATRATAERAATRTADAAKDGVKATKTTAKQAVTTTRNTARSGAKATAGTAKRTAKRTTKQTAQAS